MSKFKVGDRVKCVKKYNRNNLWDREINVGSVYVIVEVKHDIEFILVDCGWSDWWFPFSQFVRIDTDKPMAHMFSGDTV